MVVLARRASCDKKTLARQVIPLAPGYRTALSSRPARANIGGRKLLSLNGITVLALYSNLQVWFSSALQQTQQIQGLHHLS